MGDSVDPRLQACRRRNRKMRSLVRTAALLNSSLDLQEILSHALRAAVRVMDAEAASILLLDPESGDLVVDSLQYASDDGQEDALRRATRGYRVPAGEGIAGWVAREGEPLNIPDAYEDPRFHREVDRKTGMRTRAVLAMPLEVHEETLGVAEVINRRDGGCFEREDAALFRHFCNVAAVAIEKARLHQESLEKEILDRELAAAREIQAAFLPRSLPEVEGWSFGRHYRAARAVGGDFYDLVACRDERLGVLVGDVAGKGVSAALLGAGVASDLRGLLRSGRNAGEVAREANRIVAERSVRGMFVTLAVATLDAGSGRGHWASAGHLPLLQFHAGEGTARFIEGPAGPPAGVVPEATFPEGDLRLDPGDRLIFCTDGVVEALDAGDEEAGLERLRSIVGAEGAGPRTLERAVIDARSRGAMPPNGREDDLTYLELLRLAEGAGSGSAGKE